MQEGDVLTRTSGRQFAVMSMQTERSSWLCLSAATCVAMILIIIIYRVATRSQRP